MKQPEQTDSPRADTPSRWRRWVAWVFNVVLLVFGIGFAVLGVVRLVTGEDNAWLPIIIGFGVGLGAGLRLTEPRN